MNPSDKIEHDLKLLREADPFVGKSDEERLRLCQERNKKLQDEWMKAFLQRLTQ